MDFASDNNLKKHIKNIHTKSSKKQCEICLKLLATNTELRNHINGIHKGIKEFKCDLCTKYFVTEKTRKQHVVIVHEEKNGKCNICKHLFLGKTQLEAHIERIHSIEMHMKIAHEKTCRRQCVVCFKMLKTNALLRSHIISTHKGEEGFHCDLCENGKE